MCSVLPLRISVLWIVVAQCRNLWTLKGIYLRLRTCIYNGKHNLISGRLVRSLKSEKEMCPMSLKEKNNPSKKGGWEGHLS